MQVIYLDIAGKKGHFDCVICGTDLHEVDCIDVLCFLPHVGGAEIKVTVLSPWQSACLLNTEN